MALAVSGENVAYDHFAVPINTLLTINCQLSIRIAKNPYLTILCAAPVQNAESS